MTRFLTTLTFLLILYHPIIIAQKLNTGALIKLSKKQKEISKKKKIEAINFAIQNDLPLQKDTNNNLYEIQLIDGLGKPQYFTTHNAVSASSISTDQVYLNGGAGLDLDGSGLTLHQWDAGSVRVSHQEFDDRASNGNTKATHWHSSHVAGTIVGSGVNSNAKGMAYDAELIAFDWDEYNAEMAEEAAAGAIISNHSYGWLRGWEGGNTWWGDPDISDEEDFYFGFYDESARIWDSIVFNAPNFLIVKSAGNDRDDSGDGTYPDDGPYDCIDQLGIAKNNLVVAAVRDIPGGYTKAADVLISGFSSWGPADDGRIKPDISANGIGLLSTDNSSDDDYRNASGTSMSAPSVAGSVALLQQHFQNLNGQYMTAATAKALIIHTADEAGDAEGPDYAFGWGLMNTKNAAFKISENDSLDVVIEETLNESDSIKISFIATDTNAIKVTIVWTDPPGTSPEPALDPADTMLVNDLNLHIEDIDNNLIYFPWMLDKDNPSMAATNNSKNHIDNVEMVIVPQVDSGSIYTIIVDHDGVLQNGAQNFSMILSFQGDMIIDPDVDFVADQTTPTLYDTVFFTDLSDNSPTAWNWSIEPDYATFLSGTDSNSQNPIVSFDSVGSYHISLTSSNAAGSNTESKLDYIQVFEILNTEIEVFPQEICKGDSVLLTAFSSGGSGDYLFSWSSNPAGFFSNEQNFVVMPDSTTTFILEVNDGLQNTLDSITVVVNQLPEIMLVDWPEELCNEDEPPVQLNAEPEGGIFSGSAVSPLGIFSPEEAPLGWNLITYVYEGEHNCINSAADSIYVDECVGFGKNQLQNKPIKIYPIPNSGNFTIESDHIIEEVEITNAIGKVIYLANSSARKVSVHQQLTKGIYLVRVKTDDCFSYKTISVQ